MVSYTFFNIDAKGISANMLKQSSKRRRTQAQIKAEKEADARREAETKARLAEVEQLKQQVMQLQQENQTGKIASNLMS